MKKNKEEKEVNNHKKIFIIIISIVVIILATSGLFFYKYYNKNKFTFTLKESITLPLNSDANPKDYIKSIKNAKVKYNKVKTDTIGKKTITYIVTDNLFKKKHKYTYTLDIIDDIPPVIEGKDKVSLFVNSKIDLISYIKVSDNYDKDLDIKIDGEVDNKKEGTYKVKYIATDKSANTSEHTITFTIKKKSIYDTVKLEDGVIGTSSKGYKIENKGGATYVGGILIANKTYNLSSSYGGGLKKSTSSAFNEMKAAALIDGYDLRIGSGYRSFNTQKSTYKRYVKRDGQTKADTYSARPGHSEHQTGLAIDICAAGYSCISSNFNGTSPANWLSDNAYKYGFILRYPNGKTNETGYKFESWHYRYVGKDLAAKLYNGGNWITLEDYLGITSKYSQ